MLRHGGGLGLVLRATGKGPQAMTWLMCNVYGVGPDPKP